MRNISSAKISRSTIPAITYPVEDRHAEFHVRTRSAVTSPPPPHQPYFPSNQLPTDLALPEVDGEIDELTVLLHELPQTARLQELLSLLLQEQADRGPSLQRCPTRVWDDRELTGVRLPDVLIVIVVLGGHHHSVSNWGVREREGERKKEKEKKRERKRVCVHECVLVQKTINCSFPNLRTSHPWISLIL